jgi:solute:Na+ symporter, SSS family
MSWIDWLVLAVTLLGIVGYGVWKSRNTKTIETYLLADRKMPWYHVGLSVMATQASAITFLSAPGQGYDDGLRFVQFYFGLPLAMIVLCVTFIPIFHRLSVYTAYEYLETRFDVKTRTLTAGLFLLQRGISTGITIYAPALVLSILLGIDVTVTTVIMAILVIVYTVYGGAKAVSYTQMLQMSVIFAGLIMAACMVVHLLPENIGFGDALTIAGKMGRVNAIDTTFDLNEKYNLWSGLIGGLFLQLSYFGTDQSQVGRYLTGRSIAQSRLGLVMNGLVKIPMQFFILLIGVLVFSFYQYHRPPVFFNKVEVEKVRDSRYGKLFAEQEKLFTDAHEEKRTLLTSSDAVDAVPKEKLQELNGRAEIHRDSAIAIMKANDASADVSDTNYVFLSFVMEYLPVGLVGLLIAIIFLASMGSTASGLSSLTSTVIVDIYKRFYSKEPNDRKDLRASRIVTVLWGIFCLAAALFAARLGNLIEVVNILGSLFYGTILGIFVVAFYVKRVDGTAVFWSAVIAELFVVICWYFDLSAFLWLNLMGCALVVALSLLLQFFRDPT